MADAELGHPVDHPGEDLLAEGGDVEVGGRVHVVDRVRDAIADGELHRVHLVAERATERPRFPNYPLGHRRVERRHRLGRAHVALEMAEPRIPEGGIHLRLADDDAADVLRPLDRLLDDHRQGVASVVGREELGTVSPPGSRREIRRPSGASCTSGSRERPRDRPSRADKPGWKARPR